MIREDLKNLIAGAEAATAYAADGLADELTKATIVSALLESVLANEDPVTLRQILIEMGKEVSQ